MLLNFLGVGTSRVGWIGFVAFFYPITLILIDSDWIRSNFIKSNLQYSLINQSSQMMRHYESCEIRYLLNQLFIKLH